MHLRAVVRTYEPGEIILCAGDKAHQFGIVISGAIHVEGSDAQGNISVMGAFHTGDTFGEAYAALGNVPLLTSVVKLLPERATSAVAWTLSSEILWLQLLKRTLC